MYKKILVPLDGSAFSANALEHAKALAKACNVLELILIRVIEPIPGYVSVGEGWHNEATKNARKWTQSYLAEIAEDLKKENIMAKTVVGEGNAAEEILSCARKNSVDLIIMSTHGSSGVARWLLGSVTDRVVRHSICPVLVVSQHELKNTK